MFSLRVCLGTTLKKFGTIIIMPKLCCNWETRPWCSVFPCWAGPSDMELSHHVTIRKKKKNNKCESSSNQKGRFVARCFDAIKDDRIERQGFLCPLLDLLSLVFWFCVQGTQTDTVLRGQHWFDTGCWLSTIHSATPPASGLIGHTTTLFPFLTCHVWCFPSALLPPQCQGDYYGTHPRWSY